jgi:hypothetical protein
MQTTRYCNNHPERNAVSSCRSCGQYYCGDCLIEGVDYYYCRMENCQEQMKQFGGPASVVDDRAKPVKLITVATYWLPYEADIARALLESEGIATFVADEHLIHMNWLYSNAIGGIKIQIAEPDVELAREILANSEPHIAEDTASDTESED